MAGEDDLLVAVMLQLGGVVDEAFGAVVQRVAVAQPVEPHDVPAILAQGGQIGGGRRFRIFGVYAGFRGIGLHVHIMQALGIVMMLLFFHLYAKAGAEAMSPIAKATAPSFFDSNCLIRA